MMNSYIRNKQRSQEVYVKLGALLVLLCLTIENATSQKVDSERICPEIRVGSDDFPGFDLISQFRLEEMDETTGILQVTGSSDTQVAYSVQEGKDLTTQTRNLFPNSLPEKYSFVATFRVSEESVGSDFYLWQILGISGDRQTAVRINGADKELGFEFVDSLRGSQAVYWNNIDHLFDTKWHKILMSIQTDRVSLYIDCEFVGAVGIAEKGVVDTRDSTSLVKDESGTTVLVELQWMLIHCDPSWPERDTCDELKTEPTPESCHCDCPTWTPGEGALNGLLGPISPREQRSLYIFGENLLKAFMTALIGEAESERQEEEPGSQGEEKEILDNHMREELVFKRAIKEKQGSMLKMDKVARRVRNEREEKW